MDRACVSRKAGLWQKYVGSRLKQKTPVGKKIPTQNRSARGKNVTEK